MYTCPMHPDVRQDKPGMCPSCGMNLMTQKLEVRGERLENKSHLTPNIQPHTSHVGHSVNIFKTKFWTSLVLTIPVVLISSPIRIVEPEAFPAGEYLSFILASIVFFYGGWVFLASASRELRGKMPGMMTLIAIAVSTAYLWSVYALVRRSLGEGGVFGGETLFWELTTLITIMLLGHWMEMRAVQGAQGALKELSKLLPDTAELVTSNQEQVTRVVPLEALVIGDIVMVRPGGKIPADGVVVEGGSDVDESLMTGESKPVSKKQGDAVIAGASNGDGSLKIKVTQIGEHTFLAGVKRLVAEAQASKSRLQILSDKAAFYLTVIALATGIITFIVWFVASGDPAFAVERLVAVLVIACPHALGLAIPLVASISTTLGARSGLLVKQRLALEAARNIDIVLFDKTGTLTKGEYGVSKIVALPGVDENEFLRLAASVDAHSEHFIARAIIVEAEKRKLKLLGVRNFERIPGKGVKGQANGSAVVVGGEATLADYKVSVPDRLRSQLEEFAKQGQTIIYVLVNKQFMGAIALADIIREESRAAIQDLKKLRLKVVMLTGDSEEVAKWVAQELNIDEYFAKVLPGEKARIVKKLQDKGMSAEGGPASGGKVAMVGDGINDAPALTQADLGIAIGAGTNVAIESAGIILVKSDPKDIVKIIRLSRATYSKMIQNLFWATGYNVVAIPLAAGVLASRGIMLEPAFAAILMSFSTVIVAVNAMLLRRANL